MSHDQAFELLPWLVNGSLGAPERDAVEEHLRSCLPCRRELKMQRHLHEALRAQPAVHLSPHGGYDALTRQLAGTAPRADRQASASLLGRFATAVAAGVVLVAVLFWLAPVQETPQGRYETLTAPGPTAATDFDMVFVDSITAAELQALLEEIDAEIAAGPTAVGRYTVRLRQGGLDDDAVTAVLARLNTDPRVRFAGRALAAEEGL